MSPASRSRSELCAIVPGETFLATSPKATFDLGVIRVYDDWCRLDVTWEIRPTTEEREAWIERFSDPPNHGPTELDEPEPAFGRLHCSAELADGSPFPGQIGDSWITTTNGATQLALSPLPLPAGLRIRLDWQAFGIHDAITVLDTTAINQAAGRVQLL